MSWDDYNEDAGSFGGLWSFLRVGSFGSARLRPMTRYGRMTARLDSGDEDFKADGEQISEELVAALKRIAITSARPA